MTFSGTFSVALTGCRCTSTSRSCSVRSTTSVNDLRLGAVTLRVYLSLPAPMTARPSEPVLANWALPVPSTGLSSQRALRWGLPVLSSMTQILKLRSGGMRATKLNLCEARSWGVSMPSGMKRASQRCSLASMGATAVSLSHHRVSRGASGSWSLPSATTFSSASTIWIFWPPRAQPLEQLTPTHTSMGWPTHTGAVTPHVETATWWGSTVNSRSMSRSSCGFLNAGPPSSGIGSTRGS